MYAIRSYYDPVHLNPKVRELAEEIFDGSDKIRLIEPLGVVDFHNFMDKAYMSYNFV